MLCTISFRVRQIPHDIIYKTNIRKGSLFYITAMLLQLVAGGLWRLAVLNFSPGIFLE